MKLQSIALRNPSRVRPFVRRWGRINFRNPTRAWRTIFVACFYAVPGCMAGAFASLFLGRFTILLLAGAIVGAVSGAVLEGWE